MPIPMPVDVKRNFSTPLLEKPTCPSAGLKNPLLMSPVHEKDGAPTVSAAFPRNCAPVSMRPAAVKLPTTLVFPQTVRFAGTVRSEPAGGAAAQGQ